MFTIEKVSGNESNSKEWKTTKKINIDRKKAVDAGSLHAVK